VRDIDRLLSWDGWVPRNQQASFERYLSHPDARVRAYANRVKEHHEQLLQELRELEEAERLEEQHLEQYWGQAEVDGQVEPQEDILDEDLEDIPF
jgi:hypothetical protein